MRRININKSKIIIGIGVSALTLLITGCNSTEYQESTVEPEIIYVEPQSVESYDSEITIETRDSPASEECEEPTLYEQFSDSEISLIEVTIQHEVGNFSQKYKKLVAELIYNRLLSDEFPDSIYEVLYQENQFCGIERWYSPYYLVDSDTKLVVAEVFSQGDTSHDATYYYNPALSEYDSVVWFEHSGDVEYLFEYTEISWGVSYTTRFFK